MDKETAKVTNQFINKLKKQIKLSKVILHGSRATGDHLKHSDYDFMIISPDFKGKPMFKRMAEIYKYWNSPQDIEPLCYTPEEFKKKMKLMTFKQAIKTSVNLL